MIRSVFKSRNLKRIISRTYTQDKRKNRRANEEPSKKKTRELSTEKIETVMDFALVPLGTADSSMATYTATSSRVLKDSGLKHEVHPMGNIVEGDIDECLDALKEVIEKSLHRTGRLSVNVRLDVMPGGGDNRIHKKKAKITEILSHTGDLGAAH
eukprot:TRINITY_DN14852_c0_g1_i1.p1 TRINITY_DN14852_c0_g1~~TRINITY_DN14852_c0_g1_i1.p1  ORF type:complete len:155 (+),score=32.82 TRINITY_DN14852_c0_g1_i1:57-521(+)